MTNSEDNLTIFCDSADEAIKIKSLIYEIQNLKWILEINKKMTDAQREIMERKILDREVMLEEMLKEQK